MTSPLQYQPPRNTGLVLGITLIALTWSVAAHADNTLSVSHETAGANAPVTLSFSITNDDVFVGFQFDLLYPTALVLQEGSGTLSTRADDHTLQVSVVESGRLRVIAYQTDNNDFSGTSGVVLTIGFTSGTTPGTYDLSLENSVIAAGDGSDILTGSINGSFTLEAPDIGLSLAHAAFGEVPLGNPENIVVLVENTGNIDLNISNITSSTGDFTFTGATSEIISASGSSTRTVTFTPSSKGLQNADLTITSDDPDSPSRVLPMSGTGFAVNEIHIRDVDGRSGYTAPAAVTVNNMEPFVGMSVDIPLPEIARFVEGSATLNPLRSINHTLSADTSDSILHLVAHSPTNTPFAGVDDTLLTFELLLEGDAGSHNLDAVSPVLSDISASNILSDAYDGQLEIISPDLHLPIDSVGFGSVAVSATVHGIITIDNEGTDTLVVTDLLSGSPEFTHDLVTPIQVNPSGFTAVQVSFSSDAVGAYSTHLTLRSNDPNEDPAYIPLSATVEVPVVLSVLPGSGISGSNAVLQIALDNELAANAVQCDVILPPELAAVPSQVRLTNRKKDHTITASEVSSGRIRIISYSSTLQTYEGTSGVLIELPVSLLGSAGSYSISLENVVVGGESGTNIVSESNGALFEIENGKVVAVKIFLEGAYDSATGEMNTNLLDTEVLPLSQPYNTDPWYYDGDESVTEFPPETVDWVLVTLSEGDAPDLTVVARKAGLLMSNGLIVYPVGTDGVAFPDVPSGSYWITIQHRNHIAVLSAQQVSM